ncbi:hypothetical protein [Streptomyces exfoliatus]|uniref:hypothetical protein n=1 Tax=Streptomyces exfoliatus TaxID=1905 RepID=UPI001470831A|nr:hypothetical protein [Streptomyces exfoliatus]
MFATRDTVCEETPAIVATSAMEGHCRAGRERGDFGLFAAAGGFSATCCPTAAPAAPRAAVPLRAAASLCPASTVCPAGLFSVTTYATFRREPGPAPWTR